MELKDILRLKMFRGENATRNWLILIGILLWMLLSIGLSHNAEGKAKYLAYLNAENRRLQSEYVGLKSLLMKKQLRSNVYNEIKSRGFVIPKRPPVKIVKEE